MVFSAVYAVWLAFMRSCRSLTHGELFAAVEACGELSFVGTDVGAVSDHTAERAKDASRLVRVQSHGDAVHKGVAR